MACFFKTCMLRHCKFVLQRLCWACTTLHDAPPCSHAMPLHLHLPTLACLQPLPPTHPALARFALGASERAVDVCYHSESKDLWAPRLIKKKHGSAVMVRNGGSVPLCLPGYVGGTASFDCHDACAIPW